MEIILSAVRWDSTWWCSMVTVSSINLLIAILLFFGSLKWKQLEPANSKYFMLLRTLGLIFVGVASYRTIFVSSYPNRLTWFDSIFNSPFIIRCLALFAELSFIGMITIILSKFCKEFLINDDRVTKKYSVLVKIPYIAFGCIFIAQFFAFSGLITQYLTLFAIEETLWALAFISISPLVVIGLKQVKRQKPIEKNYKRFFIIMAIWCCGYLAFQLLFALPFSYYANLSQDAGKVVPPDALKQAILGFTATRDYDIWGGLGFFIWHSGYFSICVWMALFFMTAPRRRKNVQ